MNKTKVDDMLIEKVSPKVKEIERNFGSGEGLTITGRKMISTLCY